ncbi:cytochrome c oxidase assembly factor CtaG [Alkalihalobacillus sp. TS-13]|uniref:cytochrome c oxidase assembly factor CtaG n=1 Tax=Alkalihalobacillus sp. TS-13 TaxID=2842455 RepID=UPI001C880B42|nr:cytochrome c oxidase assembly factor CtaG [Alkalihalobacillus sp. TS-13]
MWEQVTMNFSFSQLWNPIFMAVTLLIIFFYLMYTGPWKNRFSNSEPVSVKKKVSFIVGIVMFYVGFGGPLYLIGHLMFSIHMIQMSVCYLMAPPLLLYGMPGWMIKPLLKSNSFTKPLKVLTKPLISLVLFNAVFSFYHFPLVFDYLMTNYTEHLIFQALLFMTAVIMWWPVICPIPEWDTMFGLKKVGYIFGNGILLTPACALIIFSESTLYSTYSNPETWSYALGLCLQLGGPVSPELYSQFVPLSPVDDQQLGGIIMKVVQEIVYGSVLGYVFFQWVRKERLKDDAEINQLLASTNRVK